MNKSIITPLICLLCAVTLCTCKGDNEADAAHARIEHARTLIEEGRLESAKTELDSVHLLYRQQVDARREAKALEDTISILEAQRTAAYADSMLQVLLPQVDPLLKRFRYDKDERYEDNGQYVSRLLQTTSNTERCFLQAYVGDNRVTRVKSYYFGPKQLCQTSIELCAVADDQCNHWQGAEHHFETDGFHSILSIENETAIEILAFIADNQSARLRVRLHGTDLSGKKTEPYTYFLSKNDKDALVETLQLAILFHDINRLENMLNHAQQTLSKLSNG